MSSTKKIAEFPDVEAKLQQPGKKSAFEKQKAEAEAKRRREEAETAAALEDFVKSFQYDGREDDRSTYGSRQTPSKVQSGPPERPGAFGGPGPHGGGTGKRHFGVPPGAAMKSGPGSLGPLPSSFNKKRPYDGFQRDSSDGHEHKQGRGRLGFEDSRDSGPLPVSLVFDASDDEDDAAARTDRAEEKATSRPTLRLANLPPGTSPALIKALMPSSLTVENVQIVPPSGPTGTERKSITAIVTLSKETPAMDIDAAVSALQNRYLGFGFFLTLNRHLSSAAISSGLTSFSTPTAAVSHPFGARKVQERSGPQGPHSGGYGRGYAPPTAYGPPAGGPIGRGGILHVPVAAPRDIKQLRMIHKVIESVLEHGPEFEALLMSRPDVQRDEKWAWIWDARSEGGIWYRWRLWEIVTGLQSASSKNKFLPLFEGSHAWKVPEQELAYEYVTGVDEFVSDPEYDSSEDDDFDDEQPRQGEGNEQEDTFLNPIEKSKLSHLLARLPTTLSRIRKGDIARVTTFAITHASRGADEVVEMIVSNIEQPYAYTSANPDYKPGGKEKEGRDQDSRNGSPAPEEKNSSDSLDISAARLVGLYVVSDILSSSSTSGIRHAWRFRQLFETALKNHKTFEMLGQMADKLNWGRLRAEKWKRSVGLLLTLWEGWCVFPVETHEYLVKSFEHPPPLKKHTDGGELELKDGRWKSVEGQPTDSLKDNGFLPVSTKPPAEQDMEKDGIEEILELAELSGELGSPYMRYTSKVDDVVSDLDIDGKPDSEDEEFMEKFGWMQMEDSDKDKTMTSSTSPATAAAEAKAVVGGFQMSTAKAAPARKRLRAADMFGGSDSEGER
ncbi:U2 snRNP-associated SURP motif-containing protein [Cladorrhinum samala]|uniref:U2 snRNP-associated SURP motif-containing protein n=1 Tax=Cladorrhinum samala TaxID=585594 RepID=A0AAV9HSV1_9PEZI|nr:U2 snRNP-associated SURP motif-containing protein [Cladorrhinum samala]